MVKVIPLVAEQVTQNADVSLLLTTEQQEKKTPLMCRHCTMSMRRACDELVEVHGCNCGLRVSVQMRRASQALAELNQQQKAVALGGSSKARYREAQVGAANECARRLESCKLSELQDQIAVLQEQLEIDQQVQMVCSILNPPGRELPSPHLAPPPPPARSKEQICVYPLQH